MRRAVLGSVANQLLKVAPCDILIVPRGASGALMATNPESTTLSSAPLSSEAVRSELCHEAEGGKAGEDAIYSGTCGASCAQPI